MTTCKKMVTAVMLFTVSVFFSSCNNDDSDVVEASTCNIHHFELAGALQNLNCEIDRELGLALSRSEPEQQSNDTTKIVVADIKGAAEGAVTGSRLGIIGALGGALIFGALESYLASYQVADLHSDKQTSAMPITYNQYIELCMYSMSNAINMTPRHTFNISPRVDQNMVIGMLHNAVVDSLFLYEEHAPNHMTHMLTVHEGQLRDSLRTMYNQALLRLTLPKYSKDLGRSDDDKSLIMQSFLDEFARRAKSMPKAETVIKRYLEFVDQNDYGLSLPEIDELCQTMGTAWYSYYFWRTKL